MEHADYAVDILNDKGWVIGQKPRGEVDKRVDIFHGVHTVLTTPAGELVMSVIPQRDDLPNLYAGQLGSTIATIRCHGETAEEAARRALRHELLLEAGELTLLRDGMVMLDDGHQNYLTAYLMVAEKPILYRLLDIGELVVIAPESVEVALTLHGDQFAPTLKAIWPSLHHDPGQLELD
jgi:hypothetical protein